MFHLPLFNLLIIVLRSVRVLSRLKNAWRRFLTRWLGLYVSRGPHRSCRLPRPGCVEILPARSSVSAAQVGLAGEEPGGGRRAGEKGEAASMGRRRLRRDMWRVWDLAKAISLDWVPCGQPGQGEMVPLCSAR